MCIRDRLYLGGAETVLGVTDGLVPLPGERGPHRLRGAATVPSR